MVELIPKDDVSSQAFKEMLGANFVELTPDKKSWAVVLPGFMKSTPDKFERLWRAHPDEKGRGVLFGKAVVLSRYQRAFGADYKFFGHLEVATAITEVSTPDVFEVKKKIRESFSDIIEKLGFEYDACLVNWYEDGSHYIGPHSDKTNDLVEGAPIFSLSWGASRMFSFTKKKKKGIRSAPSSRVDVVLNDGDLLVMGGNCQDSHKHEIRKDKKIHGRRINMTLRCFKKDKLS